MKYITFILLLTSYIFANGSSNICITKVILNWDKNITYAQKEMVIYEASTLNYEKDSFFNGYKNINLASGFETRNKLKWLYFLFNTQSCQNKLINTKKILKIFFEPVDGFPTYKIKSNISNKEKEWVLKYKNTIEIRGRVADINGSIEVQPIKEVPIPKWLQDKE